MDYTHLTDHEIAQRFVQTKEPRLFDELVRRHQSSVLQQCRKQLKDAEAAQDVSQEVWIRVFERLHQFRPVRPFAAWLSVIVHNRCHDHLHNDKYRLHQELSHLIVDGLEADEELDTENLTVPTVEILEELMEYLSGEEKWLLHLKYWQGWSIKDIQHLMQLSESAVKSRVFHVKQKLQKLLNKYRKAQPVVR